MLTRREKHVLIAAIIIAISILIIRPANDWEYAYLWIIVAPAGFYIATDPERKKEG